MSSDCSRNKIRIVNDAIIQKLMKILIKNIQLN